MAISFLAELGEQEIIDAETAARLDQALAESGNDVPMEARDLACLDRVVQARIDAALVRFAATGHGDVVPQRPPP